MLKYVIFLTLLTFNASCQSERHIKTLFDKSSDDRDKYFMQLSKERKTYWFNKYVKEVGVDTTSGNTMVRNGGLLKY